MSTVTFEEPFITCPFYLEDDAGNEYCGYIEESTNPRVFSIYLDGEDLGEVFTCLEEAQYFAQNHIHEYVEEAE